MKLVFIFGFFHDVKKALDSELGEYLSARSVIWIPQVGVNRQGNLTQFKSLMLDRAKDADEVLVIAAILRGKEWVEDAINKIVVRAEETHPQLEVRVEFSKQARNASAVVSLIRQFSLTIPEISESVIRRTFGGTRILCVRGTHQGNFSTAFEKVGLQNPVFNEYCTEKVFDAERNSNLMSELMQLSDKFDHLLYAFHGLRHSSKGLKKRFDLFISAPTVPDVVAEFQRRLRKEEEREEE